MTQFTASEVRAWFEGMVEQGLVDELTLQYGLAFADLLEAREKAVPVAYAAGLEANMRGFLDVMAWSEGEFTIPLYTHPAPSDAERLAEANARAALAAHSAQAQPPAASVTDAMVEDGCMAWNKSAGLGYAVADRDCMRAAIEAALAAQENPNG